LQSISLQLSSAYHRNTPTFYSFLCNFRRPTDGYILGTLFYYSGTCIEDGMKFLLRAFDTNRSYRLKKSSDVNCRGQKNKTEPPNTSKSAVCYALAIAQFVSRCLTHPFTFLDLFRCGNGAVRVFRYYNLAIPRGTPNA
jgi:hypothetical protein